MKFIKIASAISLSLLSASVYAASVELTPANFDKLVKSGTWLIEHFSPQCPHCINFAPEWKRLTEDLSTLETDNDFHFGTIDCLTRGDLCHQHGVRVWPTVQLWESGQKVEDYSGANHYDPLVEYIYQNMKGTKPTIEEAVLINEVGEGKNVEDEVEVEGEEVEEEEEENDEAESEEEEELQLELSEQIDEAPKEIAVVGAVLPNPEGISVELDEAKMREIKAGTTPWFIKFYSKRCGHCQALAPTWTELGSQLRNQVNIGEIHCPDYSSLCSEYDITGVPSLKMFGHGEIASYSGDRSLSSLMEFATSHSGPSVKEVSSKELTSFLEVKDVSLVYVYKDKKGNIPELIESVAKNYISTIPFYASQDPEIIKKFDLAPQDLPTVIVTKDNGYRTYTGSHDFTKNTKENREALINWIEKEQYPLISRLGPINQKSILQGSAHVVLNIVNINDATSQSKFRDIASTWFKSAKPKDKVVFAEMDRHLWRDYVLDTFNVNHDSSSKLVIYDPSTYQYYTMDVDHKELSIDRPESIYASLKNLNKLKGASTLAIHQRLAVKVGNVFSWVFKHWVISFIGFSIIGSFLYRYLTFHGPNKKRIGGGSGVLPSFRPIDSHKD